MTEMGATTDVYRAHAAELTRLPLLWLTLRMQRTSINGQIWRATDLAQTDAAGIDRVPSAWGLQTTAPTSS